MECLSGKKTLHPVTIILGVVNKCLLIAVMFEIIISLTVGSMKGNHSIPVDG